MKKTWLRVVSLITVIGLTGFVTITVLRPEPVRVETARVAYGPFQVTVEAEGRTRARDRFVVAAPVAGRLARSGLHRGDAVSKGAVVAYINPLPVMPLDLRQQAEAEARVAATEQARAHYEQAQKEFARAEALVETGDIARQDFERARNAAQTGRQQFEALGFKARAAAAEVEVAKAALVAVERAGQSGEAVVTVRAPVSGRILRLIEESERVIAAGTPIMEMSGRALEIVIDVLSSDAVRIRPGAPVLIEEWGGEAPLRAHIRLIEPLAFTKVSALGIEEQRVNVVADFVDSPGPLGDGYRVEARITAWENEAVMKIPSAALIRNKQYWSVFIIENDTARLRNVTIGHRSSSEVEILSGLKQNERLILHPSNLIADGVRVKSDDVWATAGGE
jgi:HlyD family secretion protein